MLVLKEACLAIVFVHNLNNCKWGSDGEGGATVIYLILIVHDDFSSST